MEWVARVRVNARASSPFLLFVVVLWFASAGCKSRATGAQASPSIPAGPATASMPATLRMAWLRAQQTSPGYDFAPDLAGSLRSRAGRMDVEATLGGVRLSSPDDGGFSLRVETLGIGRGGVSASRGSIDRHANGQELVLTREDDVEERYLAGPLGLEQTYVLGAQPAGPGALTIDVAFEGLTPEMAEGAVDRVLLHDETGLVRAGYRNLVAVDTNGRELPAHMTVRDARVQLVIDDVGAAYPIRVDPLVWTQRAELTPANHWVNDQFGASVSVSGSTAIIGAPAPVNYNNGAAYVFVQSSTGWIQQAKLIGEGNSGMDGDEFGFSVSLDGDTAVVGAPTANTGNAGAPCVDSTSRCSGMVYVFVRSGTTWTRQTSQSGFGSIAGDRLGQSVSLSGGTFIAGAPYHQYGVADVFVKVGSGWSFQSQLAATDGAAGDIFGWSVSTNGTDALVGAPLHKVGSNTWQGAAYVFSQSGTSWMQAAELSSTGGTSNNTFGTSVAVSGTTAIIGAPGHLDQGSAYLFAHSGGVWSQQAEINASNPMAGDLFGQAVALSGATALVGAPHHRVGSNAQQGAVYAFVQSGTAWAQQAELDATDGASNDHFGASVSASGAIDVVAAPAHPDPQGLNGAQGAVYVFAQAGTNGTACADGSTCTTGFCVGGVCCNASCGNACQSCVGAMTGGVDGTCGTVLDGTVCPGGTCTAGVCNSTTSSSGSSASGSSASAATASSSSASTGSSSSSTTSSAGSGGTGGAAASSGTSGASGVGGFTSSGPSSPATGNGCSCRTGGESSPDGSSVLALAALGFVLRSRRGAQRLAA